LRNGRGISTRRPDWTSPPREIAAFREWEQTGGTRVADLKGIHQPTLVVNGVHDEMIPVSNSCALSENLPNAVLLVYPDSGHGSLFQFHESFTAGGGIHSRRSSPFAPYESQRGRPASTDWRNQMGKRWFAGCALLVAAIFSPAPIGSAQSQAGTEAISVRTAAVDGLNLQYLIAGHGPTIVLLHGYAETSRMWRPLMPRLASSFTVIAPDLPGIGGSAIPTDGLDMARAGARIHDLVKQLGLGKAAVVGHDIGLMVAYAYAAQFPADVDRLVLMDAFLPGVEGWEPIYNDPGIWHFRFNGPTPERGSRTGADLLRALLERHGGDRTHCFPRPTVRPTPQPTRPGECARPGRISCPFSRRRGTSVDWRKPS
jgi:pimeloyl-ACP methyl ester carboxylesterase